MEVCVGCEHSRESIYSYMNRIIDFKPSHHYTKNGPLPQEVVQDEPSIAYLAEERTEEQSVVLLYSSDH